MTASSPAEQPAAERPVSERLPSERPVGRSLRPLRDLGPFLRPYRGNMLIALGALIIAAAAMLALPVALKNLIDNGMLARDVGTINRYFLLLLAAAGVFGIFAAIRFYLVTWLGERVVADLRDAVFKRVLRMDPTFFEVTRVGEVLSRLTADTTLVQTIAGVGLSIALRSTVNLVGSLTLLVATSPKLTGLLLILLPLVIAPLIFVGRQVRRLSRASQDRIADTSGMASESLHAVQTVQAFNLEPLTERRFSAAVEDSFLVAIRRTRVRAAMTAIATILVFGAIVFVLWMGAQSVLAGQMTPGKLAQFLLYAVYVGTAAAGLSEIWGDLQRASGAMERLMELLHATPKIVAPQAPTALPVPAVGKIQLQRLAFRYPSRPEVLALDDFTLDVAPGETIAIVGPSGAGKSTVFQLLLRFYDPAAGRILIDGIDIARVHPEEVRSRIGLVPQETVLFGATARENIRYGKPSASNAEIEAAARAAGADEFLRALPSGYDTFLGERGMRLSGGQRQRIAIARAILKDPPILLLDEATSSLDSESERLVQVALENLMQHRTTIIIAHRLATVLKADRIVVLDQGRIASVGTHAELLKRNDLYARLASLQFGSLHAA